MGTLCSEQQFGRVRRFGNRKISVRICIFEEGNAKLWHGYPADFKKPQDKPLDHVLKKWRDAKFITKATMSKIKGGKIKSL